MSYATADIVVDFIESDLASLKLPDEVGDVDHLVPFYLGADELPTAALERRFMVGISAGPAVVRTCWEGLSLDVTIQYVMNRESRRRMLLDIALIWKALRTTHARFQVAHSAQMKPIWVDAIQYDYTGALGFVLVTLTLTAEYHVDPNPTLTFRETPDPG